MTALPPTARDSIALPAGPLLMLFLSLSGMAIGLAVDCGSIAPSTLTSLCTAGFASFGTMIAAHWSVLPATHAMMFAGALLACAMTETTGRPSVDAPGPASIGRRLGIDALCFIAMLLGMWAAAWLAPFAARGLDIGLSFGGLVALMIFGMAIGMAVAVPLHRFAGR
jgi:hypothetical protein